MVCAMGNTNETQDEGLNTQMEGWAAGLRVSLYEQVPFEQRLERAKREPQECLRESIPGRGTAIAKEQSPEKS